MTAPAVDKRSFRFYDGVMGSPTKLGRWIAFVALCWSHDAIATSRLQSDVAMSQDERAMHDRLVALTQRDGSIADLRIELMDGSMAAHRSVQIEAGKLVSKEWKSRGAPMIHLEGVVTDSRVVELLRQLIARKYWTFQGTRFVPDAPTFLFRFWYRESKYVDFQCDAEEFRESPERADIRDLFLAFVTETELQPVPAR